jgi:transcriptional/translational regulatory protein YebC/TACO1
MEKALEAGAEDVIEEENEFQVLTSVEDFNDVRDGLEQQEVEFLEASISMIPKNTVDVTEENIASALLKLLENLEDHDDVQNVHANFDIEESLMEKLS